MRKKRTFVAVFAGSLVTAALFILGWKTVTDLRPIPESLNFETSGIRKIQVLDRNGIPLTVTYQNRWNVD